MLVHRLSSSAVAQFLPARLFRSRLRSSSNKSFVFYPSSSDEFTFSHRLHLRSMPGSRPQIVATRPEPRPSGDPSNSHNWVSGGGRWRRFSTSAGLLMERHDRDREPPHKRKRSEEDRRARGGEGRGKVKDGKPAEERPPQGPTAPSREGGGGQRMGDGVRGKNGERTASANPEKQQQQQQQRQRDGATAHWWKRHSCPGAETLKGNPDQGRVPAQRPRPEQLRRSRGEGVRAGGEKEEEPGIVKESGSSSSSSSSSVWWRRPQSSSNRRLQTQLLPSDRKRHETPPPVEQTSGVKVLHRQWEPTASCSNEPPPPGVRTTFDFSVMSYNILSQELLQDNAYLYRHCDPAVLQWNHRLPNLLDEIQRHRADIICLQEVQEDHYQNQIKPALQTSGYHCEFKKRTGSKPDGCAVVFNSSRLSLISFNPVEFFRPSDALLDRDNVGLVALLRPRGCSDPGASICVANTHLLYNPRRGDVKLAQLAILLAEIDRVRRRADGSGCPVLLCGDLNSTPWSPLYCFLTTGSLDYRGLQMGMVSGQEVPSRGQRLLSSPLWSQSLGINPQCQYLQQIPEESRSCSPTAVEGAISNLSVKDLQSRPAAAAVMEEQDRLTHTLKLQSSYQHRLMHDGRPEVTTCHSRTAQTVDYILFTPDSTPTPSTVLSPSPPSGHSLQLLGRLSLVGESELEEVDGLPNRHHSSDHLPLLARFRLQL